MRYLGEYVHENDLEFEAVFPDGTIGEVTGYDFDEDSWLVLVFYPADWTFVCPTELLALREKYDKFIELNSEIWAISTDSVFCHKSWIEKELGKLPFPLVSDRTGELSTYFDCIGVDGNSARCVVIIDNYGVIRHYSVTDNSIGRSTDEILRMIAALQAVDANDGCVACVNWMPGTELINTGS